MDRFDELMDSIRISPITGRSEYYVLDGHKPVPATLRQWAEWFEDHEKRVVRQEQIGNVWLSTVFLGMDHSFGDGPPTLFESMVFPYDKDGDRDMGAEREMRRYSTWDEAVAGHEEMARELRFFQSLEEQMEKP